MNQSDEFDNLGHVKRHPWFLIAILVILIIVVVLIRFGKHPEEAVEEAVSPEKSLSVSKIEPSRVIFDKSDFAQESSPSEKKREEKIVKIPPVDQPQGQPVSMADVKSAQELEKQGKLNEARENYLRILPLIRDSRLTSDIEDRLGKINMTLLVSARPMDEKVDYVVQRGDAIQKIAKKSETTEDLILAQNNLKTNDVLRVGDRLKVLKGVFNIEVSKGRNDLLVKLNDRFFKRYSVGTGKDGKTPVGRFVITDQKEKNPTWWKDNKAIPFGQPENILGTRWMAIKAVGETPEVRGYGIHGTWADNSIGKAESAGCIRMHNSDVEELFMLVPAGTEVTIYD